MHQTNVTADDERMNLNLNVNVQHKPDNRTVYGMLAQNVESLTHYMQRMVGGEDQLFTELGETQGAEDENKKRQSSSKKPKQAAMKSNLERFFDLEDRSSQLMKESKFDEAFGILDRIYEQEDEVRDLPFLFKYYESLIVTQRHDEAQEVYEKLFNLVRKTLRTTGDEALKFALKLQEMKKYMHAIAVANLAASLLDVEPPSGTAAASILNCMHIIRECVSELIKVDPSHKTFGELTVAPMLHAINDKVMKCTQHAGDKLLLLIRSVCFHVVECVELEVEDHDTREKTLLNAIDNMDQIYGNSAAHIQMYGTYLNNLGATYLVLSEYEQAADCFARAIDAFHHAKDFESDAKKEKFIRDAEGALSLALRKN